MFGIRSLFDNSDAEKISGLEAQAATTSQLLVLNTSVLEKQQAEITALQDELDTLDITLRAESTKLLATTSHLYRVQQLTWRQRVLMAVYQPESLWRVDDK